MVTSSDNCLDNCVSQQSSIKDSALSTMGYLILRLVYIDAVKDKPGCSVEVSTACDMFGLFEDIHGEIDLFFTALNREPNTPERGRFFELLTQELSEGVYLDSERLEEKGIAKEDQPARFWKHMEEFINARCASQEVKCMFRSAFERAMSRIDKAGCSS